MVFLLYVCLFPDINNIASTLPMLKCKYSNIACANDATYSDKHGLGFPRISVSAHPYVNTDTRVSDHLQPGRSFPKGPFSDDVYVCTVGQNA